MNEAKSAYRDAEETAKETWRNRDGEDLADAVGNLGDDVKEKLGNAGDAIREGLDGAGDKLRGAIDDPAGTAPSRTA
jgi:hypothetical protein